MTLDKFTFDDHVKMALQVKTVNRIMNTVMIKAAKGYGETSREVSLIKRAKVEFSKFRSQMDSDVVLENWSQPLTVTGIYYHADQEEVQS